MGTMVSVILPFFNAERWLEPALRSLARQDLSGKLEVIAVDDGSTDSGPAKVESARKAGAPIVLLRNERNLGIVASLNRGLEQASGRFIARMDADDLCLPHRLTRQVEFLERTGCDLCGSWFIEFGQGLSRTVRWPESDAELRAAMLFQNSICHPTIMARRAVFEQFKYREGYILAEDYDLFVRLMSRFTLANVPEPLLRYRRHPQQATQAKRDAMERITRQIREEALVGQGFRPTAEERRLHHLIRAPASMGSLADLLAVEGWLLKLHAAQANPQARHVVATQWVRACIRAAPLGRQMWEAFRSSPLFAAASAGAMTRIDLRVLSLLQLDYGSKSFAVLRRLGLSA